MQCPFPGMDPYLERPSIWPDFHDSLVSYIREALQPLLRPKYGALSQHRTYIVNDDRSVWPDVSVLHRHHGTESTSAIATMEATADPALVVDILLEEIREPYIEIIQPSAGNRIVTAIEVLSPANKQPGAGLDSYHRKQSDLWRGGTNLVEIDLLRAGDSPIQIDKYYLSRLKSRRYLAAVTRAAPTRYELYGFALTDRLPRIAVPLADGDPDVVLDLPKVFQRCWETGPYPEFLNYDQSVPGDLSDDEKEFCGGVVGSGPAAGG
ncbi:MAG: DUF4058 family protein [Planctomycetaceae bacterium]